MTAILVTGSAGFIGTHLRDAAACRAVEVLPFDLPGCDVLDAQQLHRMIGGEGIDAVINLAGALGTGELIGDEGRAVEANILGAVNVMDACAAAGVPLVQIGTGHRGQPNTYAITKACAEDLALARARWLGQRIAVVRAFHVYGEHQKPPAPWGRSPVRKILPAFACAALTGSPVEVYGDGEQVIDLVYAGLVADVLLRAALQGPWGEVIDAGTGQGITVNQAARDVIDALPEGSPATKIVHVPMRMGEPEHARVVARWSCAGPARVWPYRLPETMAWYARLLGQR